VNELSGKRLEITLFSPGALVPTFEVWEALRRNVIQISQHYLVYWSGKDAAFKAANEWAVMQDPLQHMIWHYIGDGKRIMEKICAKHGVHYLGATPIEAEHFWSKKPLRSINDLKGLKIRAGGAAAATVSALGASVVTIPGAEIYQALERGVIDACEFTTLTVNTNYAFHEVAKYITMPTYSGGGNYDWLVNQKAWNDLPDDLKKIVEVSVNETSLLYWLRIRQETVRVMEKLSKAGVQFVWWSDEDMAKLRKVRVEVMQKYAQENAEYKEKFDSQMKVLQEFGYSPK
jgi:TRAP-type mannitol/chloroaromatic compound transport system substrate-binding protein